VVSIRPKLGQKNKILPTCYTKDTTVIGYAEPSIEHRLAMADAIVHATARRATYSLPEIRQSVLICVLPRPTHSD
jgi:hypothetical protein